MGMSKYATKADYWEAEAKRNEMDAARYRFLKHDFSVMSPNIDGNHAWAYRRNFSLKGPNLDAAIDAAILANPPRGDA